MGLRFGVCWMRGLLLVALSVLSTGLSAQVTQYPLPADGNSVPFAIAPGPDGALWFTEAASAEKIGRITTGGAITEFTVPTAGSFPCGIVTGSDGAMWFTENSGTKVGRITTAGIITEFTIPTINSFPCSI